MPLAISEARRPAVGIVVVGQLSRIADVGFGAIERTCRPHVDGAGGAAFDHARQRALVHCQLGEQFAREQVEVDLAIGVLRVGAAGRGDRHRRAVQQHPGEVGAETADRNVEAFTGDFAADGDARNAVERFGEVGVRKVADAFGEDRLAEPDIVALGAGGVGAGAESGDDDASSSSGASGGLSARKRVRKSRRMVARAKFFARIGAIQLPHLSSP